MVKVGVIQTRMHSNNQAAINSISKILASLGKKQADIVCMPEQWLKKNIISDFDLEFSTFRKLARDYSMTVIPGAFYQKKSKNYSIVAPVIGPSGDVIGVQEKIHPFDYEKNQIKPGNKTQVFKTKCKFGIVICYDMVFADIARSFVKKGAEVLLSPSRIVKRGINPWHLYIQVRALENRVPIVAANVENWKFGGQSVIIDLFQNNKIVIPKIVKKVKGQNAVLRDFDLKKYYSERKKRYSDARRFS